MKPLRGELSRRWPAEPFVARVTTNHQLPAAIRGEHVLLWKQPAVPISPDGFAAVLAVARTQGAESLIQLPPELGYLGDGDVVLINPPQGGLSVVYRLNSDHNALLATGRCNCRCVMCPQPPIARDDGWHFEALLQAVRLMSPRTACLGITGGEPTLLGGSLVKLQRHCRAYLPDTVLHLLTNGRAFRYADYACQVAQAAAPASLVGVPLYSDLAEEHDFICQAKGAFDETIRGLLNLHRFKVPVELRFVVEAPTAPRIVAFSRFVTRNFPRGYPIASGGRDLLWHLLLVSCGRREE
jgi:sulfatase maturation enzyme AslB (radical SAM superfamily)